MENSSERLARFVANWRFIVNRKRRRHRHERQSVYIGPPLSGGASSGSL